MNNTFTKSALTVLLCLLVHTATSQTADGAKPPKNDPLAPYTVIDLGGFPGQVHQQSETRRMSNPDGVGILTIVGDSIIATGEKHAAVWIVQPELGVLSLEDLTPVTQHSQAKDTNDAGWVVGQSTEIGFLSIPGEPLIELPALSTVSGRVSNPMAINNANQIVGYGLVDIEVVIDGETLIEPEWHAMLWQVDETGLVVDLIDLGFFDPTDINDSGVIAGHTESRAAIATVDLQGDVHITALSAETSMALALNDVGQVVGWIQPEGEPQKAFIWDAENGLQPLGVLPNKNYSVAYGINNKGEVVGLSSGWPARRNTPTGSGFLWRDGVMMDLNDLHDTTRDFHAWIAFDINDESQIAVGLKVYLPQNESETHGGLMSPVLP